MSAKGVLAYVVMATSVGLLILAGGCGATASPGPGGESPLDPGSEIEDNNSGEPSPESPGDREEPTEDAGPEGGSDEPSADPVGEESPPEDSGDDDDLPAASGAARTLVGQVEDTLGLIGIIEEDSRVIAYVCDGDDGPRSLSEWYEGTLEEDGSFRFEPSTAYESETTKAYGESSPLWGTLSEDEAWGWLYDAEGRQLAWEARIVEEGSPAGLYFGDDGESLTSIVVLNAHLAQGLSRSRGDLKLNRVTPPTRVESGGRFDVKTPTRDVEVNVLRTPIDLRDFGIIDTGRPVKPEPPDDDTGRPKDETVRIPAPENTIQIKFREGLTIRLPRNAAQPEDLDGRALVSDEARELLEAVADGTWYRSHLVDERSLDEWRAQGEKRIGEKLPDLNLYFNLQLAKELDTQEYIERFRKLREVEWAWIMPDYYSAVAPDYANSQGLDVTNAELPYQQYLDAAPVGVDARYAWEFEGGNGQGVKVVDIETAFNDQHVDLPDMVAPFGQNLGADAHNINHGTATLGVIAALDDGAGVTGIAHAAEVSFLSNAGGVYQALVGAVGLDGLLALAAFGQALEPGDVIVLEQQLSGPNYPGFNPQFGLVAVEWYKPNYDVIRIATANGLVVVEAAGNGYQNFDGAEYLNDADAYHQPFRWENGQRVNDSGAIIVGAGLSGADWTNGTQFPPHARHNYSNYGGRVDLHSWGDAVVTTGDGFFGAAPLYSDGPNDIYLDHYGGTSSATAIMGGTVAAYQGFYKAWTAGNTLDSTTMRTNLRSTGTPQAGSTFQNIGPMPDLRAAIDLIAGNPEPTPEDPELVQVGCEMPAIFYPDLTYDCEGVTPLPAPSWSLPSGVYGDDLLEFLRPVYPNPWPASSVIQYTLDGTNPVQLYPCGTGADCPRVWTKTDTNNCVSMEFYVEAFTEPLICNARVFNVAYCNQPGSVSPIVTEVYVPEGYIREPVFDQPSSYDDDLRISMRTGNPPNYPDGFMFVAYTLDGTTPVYGDDASIGGQSPVWTDWQDDIGLTIPIFTDDNSEAVTLKCRNYLVIGGKYIGGEVVEWTFPRLD